MNKMLFYITCILGLTISLSGYGIKDPYKEIGSKNYTYLVDVIRDSLTGENQIILSEYKDGTKVRTVKKVSVLDKDIPKSISFDGCKSIKHIPIFEKVNDKYIELNNIDWRDKYSSYVCKIELIITKNKNSIDVNIPYVTRILYISYLKDNGHKPYVPTSKLSNPISKKIEY